MYPKDMESKLRFIYKDTSHNIFSMINMHQTKTQLKLTTEKFLSEKKRQPYLGLSFTREYTVKGFPNVNI